VAGCRRARQDPAHHHRLHRALQGARARGRAHASAGIHLDTVRGHLPRREARGARGRDINFFTHHGFDWGEIKHAIEENLGDRDTPRGASTISQQLVKNLWLSPGRSPLRKVKEAILTWQLERTLSKRRILELYLNVVELGPGIYGVGPAARAYFGKPAADLGEDEAALLAASLPRPRSWHPGSKSRAYARYAATIRSRMNKAEFLLKQI